MFACLTSRLAESARLSFFMNLYHFYLLGGAGWFDLKHAEIPRLWPASTLMSPFSAADKFLCESHHLFSCRRHSPRLLICRPARRANWAHYPFGRGIFRHLLHLLCALTASVPRYSSVLSSHFQISSPPHTHTHTTPFFSSLQHQQPPPLHTTSPQGLMGAQQYKFPFIPVAGADDTAALYPTDWRALRCRFTVHGSHSGAAAHLEWSTLTEKQGPTDRKSVV